MEIVITKKRSVDPTLLHKWVVQKMDSKGVDSKKVSVSAPQSSKTVFMNTVEKSRLF
jgi:hypothetical protein